VIPALLFLASAAFVWWRNTQVGVLVDLSYIVNIATRIALGDVPYRDFPLAQAPGEFLIQAALIKTLGAHYQVEIVYASLVGGAATTLTSLIARRLLAGAVASPNGLAAILCLPLIPLGVYGILPNPFYDCDACLVVLATLALLFAARDHPGAARFIVAGALASLPLFIKQNIGGAFLIALVGVLFIEAVAHPPRRRELRWFALGVAGALFIEVAVLQIVVGVDAYVRWAWTFAMTGRGVTFERIQEFVGLPALWVSGLAAALAIAAPRISERARLLLTLTALGVLATSLAPAALVGPAATIPPLLLVAVVLSVVRAWRDGPDLALLLPLVLLATTLGTLQSQGLEASSFGIFPLLSLAVACLIRDLAALVPRPRRLAPYAGAAFALVLVFLGSVYTITNHRLRFIDVNPPGPVMTSTFPSLGGLSARGPYIGELDAMLFWMRDNVPPEEGFVFLPGEDPAFYALGRKPALPSVYFYDVATPYTPAELSRIADDVGLRWVIVKERLQLRQMPPLEPELVARLTARATLVTTIGPYRVFRR
jgi:hypothetical protein